MNEEKTNNSYILKWKEGKKRKQGVFHCTLEMTRDLAAIIVLGFFRDVQYNELNRDKCETDLAKKDECVLIGPSGEIKFSKLKIKKL